MKIITSCFLHYVERNILIWNYDQQSDRAMKQWQLDVEWFHSECWTMANGDIAFPTGIMLYAVVQR